MSAGNYKLACKQALAGQGEIQSVVSRVVVRPVNINRPSRSKKSVIENAKYRSLV